MKVIKAMCLVSMFLLVSCAALESERRSPASKEAHQNFLKKKEGRGPHYWRYDRATQN